MENLDAIARLEKIDSLLNEYLITNRKYESGVAEETAEKLLAYKNELGYIDVPPIFSRTPTSPIYKAEEITELENKYNLLKKLLPCSLIAAILFAILQLTTLATLAFMALILFGFMYSTAKSNYTTKKENYDSNLKNCQSNDEKIHNDIIELEENRNKYIENARKYKSKLEEQSKKCEQVVEEFSKMKDELKNKLDSIKEELLVNCHDFISPEYMHLSGKIASLLKSHRADTYKEALNLAIAEEKEEEREAQRRAEEAERTRIMQQEAQMRADEARRQTAEMERHNAEMERHQNEANKIAADQARSAEQRARAEEKRRKEREADERREQVRRCNQCAYAGSCTMHTVNCPSFKPRVYRNR